MKNIAGSVLVCASVALSGCIGAAEHRQAVEAAPSDALTVGKVQREIRIGMTSAEVVEALGSPNMVTTDEQRREVWVYDRISTESVYSRSGAYGTLILLGGSTRAGATSTSQQVLTIVVKFDAVGRVRDFAYRQSKF